MVNQTIYENIVISFKDILLDSTEKTTEFIQNTIPGEGLSRLFLIFIGLFLIFISAKLTAKLSKLGLIVVGGLLIVGGLLSFLS